MINSYEQKEQKSSESVMDANEWRENRPDSGMCLCLTDEQKEEGAARRGNATWCLQVFLTEREKSSETNSS